MEREVLVGWFANLGGLSLLKYVQFLFDLLFSFYLTVMDWFGCALWCQDNDQTWLKNNIMVKRYLKSVPWRTSHVDHSNALWTLARSLIINIVMILVMMMISIKIMMMDIKERWSKYWPELDPFFVGLPSPHTHCPHRSLTSLVMARLETFTVGDNDDDDIYIMMKCLSVCLSVTKNHHFLLGVSCDYLNYL